MFVGGSGNGELMANLSCIIGTQATFIEAYILALILDMSLVVVVVSIWCLLLFLGYKFSYIGKGMV